MKPEDNARRVSLCAMGDVMVNRTDDPGAPFRRVQRILDDADLVFGNCEGAYTDVDDRAPSCVVPCVSASSNLRGLEQAGFDVMSCANNHVVDAGHHGLQDTLEGLRRHGIAPVGAGNSIAEARAPVIVERHGLRVAFLAYASVFPAGYDARATLPGIAPMRAQTLYAAPETRYYSPGEDAEVFTFPLAADADALREDIRDALARADVVITTFHWGLFIKPRVVTQYERAYARAAIEAGAAAVIGHHHHTLRGIEHYRGRPILYGLGHFVFDIPDFGKRHHRDGLIADVSADRSRRDGQYAINARDEYPLLPFHPDARMTMLARLELTGDGVADTALLPCYLLPSGEVEPLDPDSERGRQVIDFVLTSSADEGLSLRCDVDAGPTVGGFRHVAIR